LKLSTHSRPSRRNRAQVPIGQSSRISDANGRSRRGSAPMNPRRSLSGTMSVIETPVTARR